MNRQPRRTSGGFVLALTLWILAAVAIVASYFADQVSRSVQLARQAQIAADALVAMSDTRNEILYRLTAVPMSGYGLGVDSTAIRLDNRPYRGDGRTLVRLLDERGLVNLIHVDRPKLSRMLALMGESPDASDRLIDSLLDFQEEGDLHRLNAPPKSSYPDMGLPPPRNAPLLSPLELKNVAGWRDEPQLWGSPSIDELTSAAPIPSYTNPNTAPWQVLMSWLNIDRPHADAIIALRQLVPIMDEATLAAVAGVDPTPLMMQVFGFPSGSIRLTQTAPSLHWAQQFRITLASDNEKDTPWRIDYVYKVSDPDSSGANDGQFDAIPALPARPIVFPQPPPTPF